MTTTKKRIIDVKSPTWVRALQIGIGVFAIGLALAAVILPVLTVVATFTAVAIILLLFGIEQVVAGVFSVQTFSISPHWSWNISHNPLNHYFCIPLGYRHICRIASCHCPVV